MSNIKDNKRNMTALTASINKPFTREDILRAVDKIKSLPPIVLRMEVSIYGFEVLQKQLNPSDRLLLNELNVYNGIKIVIANNSEIDYNQAKLYYSDGTEKVIEAFKKHQIQFYQAKEVK